MTIIAKSCPLCQNKRSTPYAQENGYNLVKCSKCGLLYVSNPPKDYEVNIAHKYGCHEQNITNNNNNKSRRPQLKSTGRFKRSRIKRYLNILKDIYRNDLKLVNEKEYQNRKLRLYQSFKLNQADWADWLDIGCGHGEFIIALEKYTNFKIHCSGLELNKSKIESCRKKGIQMFDTELEQIQKKFSHISLLNVFSHLTNPKTFLSEIKKRLKKDGELLIETGDTAHLKKENHPQPFLLPDHLIFANQMIVTKLLNQVGFEVISVHKYQIPQNKNLVWLLLKEFQMAKDLNSFPLPNISNLKNAIRTWKNGDKKLDMFIRAKYI